VLHQGVTSVFTLLTLFFLLRDGDAINDQLHRAVTRTFGARGAIMCAQATPRCAPRWTGWFWSELVRAL